MTVRDDQLSLRLSGYDALTSDGSVVSLSVVGPDDVDELRPLLGEVPAGQLVAPGAAATGVVVRRGGAVAAVSTARALGPDEWQVSIRVDDAHRHRGLATLLLEDLAARAHAQGRTTLVATAPADTALILDVLRHSGLSSSVEVVDDTVRYRIAVEHDVDLDLRVSERDVEASARSLDRLLAPASVVVAGAGHRPDGVGHQVVAHLKASGYLGAISVLNRSGTDVCGVPACSDVAALAPDIDLAVVAVPAPQVLDVVTRLLKHGVGAIAVLSAGLGESAGGVDAQRELRNRCRAAGARLLGPNCIGLVNTDPAVRLDASFLARGPRRGPVAVVSQSGAVASGLASMLEQREIGVSTLVTLGNSPDVGPADLLARAAQDPATSVVLLHLESIADPPGFTRAAAAASLGVPVVLLKPGRTDRARAAVMGHTGSGVDDDDAVDALCRRAGVLRVDGIEDLADLAALRAGQPAPRGRRTAVLGNSGGPGVLAVEACAEQGLLPPDLTQHTQERLRALLPDSAVIGQLVDATATVSLQVLHDALETVVEDPGVDAVVVTVTPLEQLRPAAVRDLVDRVSLAHPDIVVVLCLTGAQSHGPGHVPCFEDPARAVRALGGLVHWREGTRLRRLPVGPRWHPAEPARARARAITAEAAVRDPLGGWLARNEVRALLAAYEIAEGRGAWPSEGRRELQVAAVRRERWGALVRVGRGGEDADLDPDRQWVLAPAPLQEVRAALDRLRCAPALQASQEHGAVLGLDSLVHRVSLLVDDLPEVAELDLGRVLVDATASPIVLGARVRVAPAAPVDGEVRRLRA